MKNKESRSTTIQNSSLSQILRGQSPKTQPTYPYLVHLVWYVILHKKDSTNGIHKFMWGVNTLDVSQYLQELDLNKPIPISKTKMCESKEKNRFNNIFAHPFYYSYL